MGKNLTSILEMANWGNHVIYMIKFEIEEGHPIHIALLFGEPGDDF